MYNFSRWGDTTVDLELNQLPHIGCSGVVGTVCPNLVTITVGADDLGITNKDDLIKFWIPKTISLQSQDLAASLSANLAKTLTNIVHTVHHIAPKAEIIVLTNYPNPSDFDHCPFAWRVFDDAFFAGPKIGLDKAIGYVAAHTHSKFLDTSVLFINHGIESDQPWFFGTYCEFFSNFIKFSNEFDPHPNGAGQQCIASLSSSCPG